MYYFSFRINICTLQHNHRFQKKDFKINFKNPKQNKQQQNIHGQMLYMYEMWLEIFPLSE